MNPTIMRAVGVVTFALIFYSVAVITQQRKETINRKVLFFLTGGVILDISSTALMIFGSTNIPITVHGCLGYSALLLMLIDAVIIWRHWGRDRGSNISRKAHLYTRLAYGWWVFAYVVGAIMSVLLS